ncbi:MAG: Ribulose-phosphate 3-epimerase [Candidatus Yanofskybacteria bacterium GW2011_GWF1_44_227]|uniref:Ribulose-phosphate 3-epimerase n=1 Tax=Candidatus Yanofskybacteria bacterium GW2011_GWE2_40_11 TaxID=1619033 RepID=A0A0G0T071_9BACT|nr:MAG: Ribulose-phosphate 3-epimerase [Candidatus Yanofskybacteria bacterium GW2011_GWE1_40_10]KKR40525.1 MAG: Ribulose-phosphate 3-epimerase [Candidatus Yanofskybacteria bacterium GW2011_GWE2_40_11]KKT14677.1 MAG: Ribulose-phosphate 3-epimerase [Candidatus Yanofskybacteria bacterium GW2011_GWF2_43_596]KKT52793.1 MAG: Ribulose-phosphate 3-epimerase [Candidatus Yanofskybacteria bacterium GW2011_GWF1_44_227]OGN35477.1 MAG: hypothetical protein A2207_01930 [Candidatus Yanofskybacteria bacterium R
MIEIIPSIIAKSFDQLEGFIRKYEPFFNRVSIDISDGNFTPTRTISGYEEIPRIETDLSFDVHLMVSMPGETIKQWLETKVDRYFIHLENGLPTCEKMIGYIHEAGKQVGVVVNPTTAIDRLSEVIDKVDYVQLMTVDPGFYGNKFLDQVVDNIREVKKIYPNKTIAVDGGVNLGNIEKLVKAGVSIFIMGTYFLKSEDIKKSLDDLNKSINNTLYA